MSLFPSLCVLVFNIREFVVASPDYVPHFTAGPRQVYLHFLFAFAGEGGALVIAYVVEETLVPQSSSTRAYVPRTYLLAIGLDSM